MNASFHALQPVLHVWSSVTIIVSTVDAVEDATNVVFPVRSPVHGSVSITSVLVCVVKYVTAPHVMSLVSNVWDVDTSALDFVEKSVQVSVVSVTEMKFVKFSLALKKTKMPTLLNLKNANI